MVLLALLALSSPARADTPPPVVVVLVQGPNLDAAEVREAIGRELDARVADVRSDDAIGTLDVRVTDTTVTVAYRGGGAPLERTIDRPRDRRQDVEVIALLAGNLARDEAAELARRLARPKPEPETSEPEAPPAPSRAPVKPAPKPAPPKSAAQPTAAAPEKDPGAEGESTDLLEELRSGAVNLSLFHPLALFPDSHERVVHFELGLFYSRVGALDGAAINAIAVRTDRALDGATVAGIWTGASGPSDGAIISGVATTSRGKLRGAEVSGVLNLRRGDLDGAQVAGVVNVAGAIEGSQISVVNVGGTVEGAQIGLVNVARRVRGAQVGLVNVAERVDGASVAPISFLRDNRTQLLAWSDTTLIANIGVRYVTGPLYTFVTAGGDPMPANQEKGGAGAGIGAELWRLDKLSLGVEALYRFMSPSPGEHSGTYRAIASYQLAEPVAVFAGAGGEHRVVRDQHQGYLHGALGAAFF